jgi:hypothetical protein
MSLSGTDWCEHCQLPASQCAHRQLSGAAWWAAVYELAADGHGERIGPLIESRYYGRCPGCGVKWEPGDEIAYDEEQAAWICAGCADL